MIIVLHLKKAFKGLHNLNLRSHTANKHKMFINQLNCFYSPTTNGKKKFLFARESYLLSYHFLHEIGEEKTGD